MKVASKAKEQDRSFNITKISVLLNVMLLIAFIGQQIFMHGYLIPSQKTEYVFFQVRDRSEQVVRVLPIKTSKEGKELLREQYVKQYVQNRESLDLHTEKTRWDEIQHFHSRTIDTAFMKLMHKDNKDSPFRKFIERQMTRQVEILNVWNLDPNVPNTYRIEWQATDSDKFTGEIKQVKKFMSMVTAVLDEKFERYIRPQYKVVNPIGLTVVKYTVQPIAEQVKQGEQKNESH